jgi:hypothetical protein
MRRILAPRKRHVNANFSFRKTNSGLQIQSNVKAFSGFITILTELHTKYCGIHLQSENITPGPGKI